MVQSLRMNCQIFQEWIYSHLFNNLKVMKNYLNTFCLLLLSIMAFSGCQDLEGINAKRNLRTVHASFENGTTRVGIEQSHDSRDMITKWQEGDKIHVIVSKGNNIVDIGSVPVHDISSDGKSCVFQYAIPDDFDPFGEGFELLCFTDNCNPKIKDGDIYYNATLTRMPISQFKAPLMFDTYVKEDNSFGAFRHYGTYEIMHVTNNTDKAISFQLSDYSVPTWWYKKGGFSIRQWDNSYIVDFSYEEKSMSPPVTIPAHGTDMVVSWYIPNGKTIDNAQIVANIDGQYVYSANTLSSKVTLCTGIAYHIYATWDGKELRFGKGDINEQKIIKVDPTEIKFGNVPVGTSKTEHFTVSNVGDIDLTFKVDKWHEDEFDIPESGKEFKLAAGKSKVFDVVYTPKKVGGHFNYFVEISSDAENGTQTVDISGTGTEGGQVKTETFTIKGVSFKMIAVEGGTFLMGASDEDRKANSDERPRHQVTLSSFSIGETVVTQELWEAVMGEEFNGIRKGDHLPMQMSYNDCMTFIFKLNSITGRGFRMPTEAEWEFAARGGNKSKGYTYCGSNNVKDVAWYDGNSDNNLHDVGTKAANELGLYDMSGNVWEWCNDWYDDKYYSYTSSDNPIGPDPTDIIDYRSGLASPQRVLRGGSWRSEAICSRATYRYFELPYEGYNNYGLRLVLTDGRYTPESMLSCPDNHHPHKIDLGLPSGTKWACCNVGATKPEDIGGYYSWGETEEKDEYDIDNYRLRQNGSYVNVGDDISGSKYDVAHVKWGGDWQMPTLEEVEELLDNCTSEWPTLYAMNGCKITSKTNGKSIFLPVSGVRMYDELRATAGCYYWISTLHPTESGNAYFLEFRPRNQWVYEKALISSWYKFSGQCVRPVSR